MERKILLLLLLECAMSFRIMWILSQNVNTLILLNSNRGRCQFDVCTLLHFSHSRHTLSLFLFIHPHTLPLSQTHTHTPSPSETDTYGRSKGKKIQFCLFYYSWEEEKAVDNGSRLPTFVHL